MKEKTIKPCRGDHQSETTVKSVDIRSGDRNNGFEILSNFCSGIVHEMRNPLSSIMITLQAFERKMTNDPNYHELASLALSQAERLEKILAQLLDYGHCQDRNTSPILFSELAKHSVSIHEKPASGKRISIEVTDKTGGLPFPADPRRIRICLDNLLSNAIHFTPEKGTIRISGECTENTVVISVEDGGEGFSEEERDRLFQPFYTTRDEALGLGLPIVKNIVENHGGAISARNIPGGGAFFSFSLPIE